MMHDVRSMVDNRPTQIPREGWSFTRCVPGCCNQWYERSYKGSKCCDTAGPWTYWPKPPRGSRVPECQDTGNVAARHPRGETPGLRGWHGGLGNPEADPGIPWDGNVP